MYSTKKNVQILVSLLKEHGIRHAVLSPGSRNMAIVASIEADPWFTCYSVVDERSAAYFAIGVALAQGSPVMLSCTSAQATRNYVPAMTEAYYRGTPLVVVTADYRAERIDQGIMQTVDQMSLPRDTARASVRLPVVRDALDEAACTRLVNRALLELDHHGSGPVHINIPIEEHWDGGVAVLPRARKTERQSGRDPLPSLAGRSVLVAIGQHAPFSAAQTEAIEAFCRAHDAAVYSNHLSNYHGPSARNVTLALESLPYADFAPLVPDVLVTLGGQVGNYAFDGLVRDRTLEHWQVGPSGTPVDTYDRLTRVVEGEEAEVFGAYLGADELTERPFARRWADLAATRTVPRRLPMSHALVARDAAPRIPAGTVMHFAILSSLRNWGFFELDPSVECYSNVAAFGIDGCVSTFLGHAVSGQRLSVLVVGDLSFFYDMNSIGIRHLTSHARILLVNNGGGGEFRLYSNAAATFGDQADQHIAAAGHFGSARGWVESAGWTYASATTADELAPALDVLLGESDAPVLVEVFTTMADDSEGVRLLRESNAPRSVRSVVKRAVPPPVRRALKQVVRGG